MMTLKNISLVLLLVLFLQWTNICECYNCYTNYVRWNSLCDGFPDCLNGDDEIDEVCRGKDCGFLCDFGKSIEWNSVCNGRKDCFDGSDEGAEACKKIGCSYWNGYQCENGQCIYKFQVCDGEIDCDDSSDENNLFCSNGVCNITCPDDICNTASWICDGEKECSNGDDEGPEVCKRLGCKRGYQCPSGSCSRYYIRYCDGFEHCADGVDEDPAFCLERGCYDQYRVQCDNGQCLPFSRFEICDGFNNCDDGSDEALDYCDGTECKFNCIGGRCNTTSWICDGYRHCSNGADEAPELCKEIGCKRGFQCGSGECLSSSNDLCDGRRDCVDGSDEDPDFCLERECSRGFKCENGQCISHHDVCDGRQDCVDGSDENSTLCLARECSKGFKCENGQCIYHWYVCNGRQDCVDGSDENSTLCLARACSRGFKCDNGQCIYSSQVCDGYTHCVDGSDEDAAVCLEKGCKDGSYFQCDNGQCLRGHGNLCDGHVHCNDGSDEKLDYCDGTGCNITCSNDSCASKTWICDGYSLCDNKGDEAPEICQRLGCKTDFQCDNGQCLLYTSRLCDGRSDCDDGSDEAIALCLERGCRYKNRFRCKNGQCLPPYDYRKVCDGNKDCLDGSDEDPEICVDKACNITCTDEYDCSSIPWLCDNRNHCYDGADESFELCSKIGCKSGVHCNGYCQNVEAWWNKCDGENRCITGYDDSADLCSVRGCNPNVTCANGQCLKSELLFCDGGTCCEDGSDEDPAICLERGCRNKAQCTNGQCLRSELYFCDGVVHCDDGSDEVEANCMARDCLIFQCDNGQCLKGLYLVCDGVEDCLDGSDETTGTCGNVTDSETRCPSTRIYLSDTPCGKSKGECIRTGCTSCDSGFREGNDYRNCGDLEPQYKCCMDHVATSACCHIYGDPHIQTYDLITYAVQEVGRFTVSEDKDGSWKVEGIFSCPSEGSWWTMIDGVRVTVGGNVIEVDENGIIKINNEVNNRRVIITGGIAIIRRPTFVSISLESGVTVILTPTFRGYTFKMCIQDRWFNRVEGLCGSWDGDTSNDNAAEVRQKQCFLEEMDVDVEERRPPDCPKDGTPESRQWCANQTATMAENCPSVDSSSFFYSCAFDYCLGGEDAAFLSLGAFIAECFPPKQASCSASGFRFYNNFENEMFQFMGTECEYDLAKDCSGNGTWSVRITQAQEELRKRDGLLITSVTIHFNGVKVVLVRAGRRVLVDGEEILEDSYESPHDFILTHSGNMIIFMSVDLEVKYNFRQLIHVNLEETWYEKTCGLCGPWNDIDDFVKPSGHDHQIKNGCEPANKIFSCKNSAEQKEAEKICMTALQSVQCTSTHPATRVERCATEYCMGGDAFLCEHVLEYMDECYDIERNEEILQHTPKYCRPRTTKTSRKVHYESLVQSVKITKKKEREHK